MKKIFYNGDILTLEKNNYVQAICIEDGIIKKCGSKDEIMSEADSNTEIINLEGKCLMPAFIDAHSHFSAVANSFLQVDLSKCIDFNDIKEEIRKYINKNNIKKGEWIRANGYDNNYLIEKKHPTKQLLDNEFKDYPIVLQHVSGHIGVFNEKALELLGVSRNTESSTGGRIEYSTGIMEENDYVEYIKKIGMPNIEDLTNGYKLAQEKYLSYGITTFQEGMMTKELIPIYKYLVENNIINLDLIAYLGVNDKEEILKVFEDHKRKYKNNFKIGGYKIFLDGSPQGRTAWMRTPYIDDINYYGYSTMEDNSVYEAIKMAMDDDLQILAHCNGDMAAEQYIEAIEKIGKDVKKIRPVIIHAQLIGIDQLEKVKEFGLIPSYFVAHTYYWGDIHIENFGLERARKISPAKSTLEKNILFTFHQDSPIIEPNMFETIMCAVERKTKKDIVLGEEGKIDVLNAIKAVTINAAYQYFEENEKGSIKEGKKADLILIDKNPLKIKKEEIRNIKILETMKNGKVLYKA